MTRERAIAALTSLVLAAVAAALYAPVTDFPFVGWDDEVHLLANPWVRTGLSSESLRTAFVTSWNGNWAPAAFASHMLDFSFYGADAGGHHRTNLLLHALNVVLLFGLLHTTTGALFRPAAVALLFALHPVNVESVAWVSERKGVLSASFGLASLWCYAAHERGGVLLLRRLALLCFGLGLLAKPTLIVLPVLLLLLDRWPLERFSRTEPDAAGALPASLPRRVLEKWPYLVVALAFVAAMFATRVGGAALQSFGELPLTARLANAVVSTARYLGMLVWPQDLAVHYPHPSLPGSTPYGALTVFAAAALLAGLAAAARRLGSAAVQTGLAWFAIGLLPAIGLVQVGSQALADRFLYLPAIGIFIAVVWGVSAALPERGPWPRLAAGALLVALVPLTLASRAQIEVWRRSESLYRHATRVTRANHAMHYGLANTLRQRGRIEEAVEEYGRAIAIHPGMGEAHFDLGTIFTGVGRNDVAIEHFRLAARSLEQPVAAYTALGLLLRQQGDMAGALEVTRERVTRFPRSPDAQVSLALLLRAAGRPSEAIASYEAAAALAPEDERWPRAIAELRQEQAGTDRGP